MAKNPSKKPEAPAQATSETTPANNAPSIPPETRVAKKQTLKSNPAADKPLAKPSTKPADEAPVADINASHPASPIVKEPASKKTAKPPAAPDSTDAVSEPVKAAPKKAPKAESAASKSADKALKAVVPVPPPKIKKPILDVAPEIVIKQAYNPAKLPPFVKKQQQRLFDLRNSLLDSMDMVAKDGLRNRAEGSEASVGGMHMADAGSDAYDRDFALSMLSKEQDALYEINEALDRVDRGVYGLCELSGAKINDERLEAIPYARYTREMQEQIERDQMGGRQRRAPVRSVFGLDEDGEEGEEGEEEDRPSNSNQSESSLDFMKE